MNYTQNFHLPQWDKDDRIMMDDFNQMASALESALVQNQQAVQAAQQIADQANTRAFFTGKLITGSYRAPGGTLNMNLGVRPVIAIFIGEPNERDEANPAGGNRNYSGYLIGWTPTPYGKLTDTGFTLTEVNRADFPNLNAPGHMYSYVVLYPSASF